MRRINYVCASELLAIAESYYRNRDRLIYSPKGNTFLSPTGTLYDEAHQRRGRIDCSTFIHLILQGIPYEESPYVTGNPEDFFRVAATWGDEAIRNRIRSGLTADSVPDERVRKANQLARYYDEMGRCMWGESAEIMPGDILFFQVSESRREEYLSFHMFQAISHVAIAAEDSEYMYESAGTQRGDIERNALCPGIRKSLIANRGVPIYCVRLTSRT